MTGMLHNFSHAGTASNASQWPAFPSLQSGLTVQYVLVIALFVVIIFVSVVGNVVVLCVLGRYRRVSSITNALVASLSVCDLIVTFTSVFAVSVAVASRGRHGDNASSACTLVTTFSGVFGGLSTAVVCMIAADRYYAVVRLPRHRFTKATMCSTIAVAAAVISTIHFPWRAHPNTDCLRLFGGIANTDHQTALVARVLVYVTTCVMEMFFCGQFCKVLRCSSDQVRPASAAVHQLRFRGEMHTLTTILIFVGVQLFCRSGIMLLRPFVALAGWHVGDATNVVAMWLFTANGAVNPTVYMLRNPLVVAAFRRHRQCNWRVRDQLRASLAYATGPTAVAVGQTGAWECEIASDVTRDTIADTSLPPYVFYVSSR